MLQLSVFETSLILAVEMEKKIRWCTERKKMFLVVMNVYQENYRSIAKGGWMQKLDLVSGAVHNFVCCLFSYIFFIYNNTLGICLCFKAKGHGTRMTSEQSLKWWGFLQDGVLCSLSYHELYFTDYIMYISYRMCSHFR